MPEGLNPVDLEQINFSAESTAGEPSVGDKVGLDIEEKVQNVEPIKKSVSSGQPLEVISYAHPETGEGDREAIRESVEVIINDWQGFFAEALESEDADWSDILLAAQTRFQENKEQLNALRERNPDLALTLSSINRCMGRLTDIFETNAALIKSNLRRGFKEVNDSDRDFQYLEVGNSKLNGIEDLSDSEQKQLSFKLAMDSASWQRDAIWSLIALDSLEFEGLVNPGTKQRFIEVLHSSLELIEQKAQPDSGSRTSRSFLTGLFGPVKLAMLAKKAGYLAYISTPHMDVHGKVDMLLKAGENDFVATQIKATRQSNPKSGDKITLVDNPERLDEMKSRQFARMKEYCDRLETKPTWEGTNFHPAWLEMFDLKINDAEFKRVIGGEVDNNEVNMLKEFMGKYSPEQQLQNAA